MNNAYLENSLEYDIEKCTGCRMCVSVCPQAVFEMNEKRAKLVRPANCMECGACQKNCPEGAITVESGVGCAYAMMYAAITGKKEPTCGCSVQLRSDTTGKSRTQS